MVTKAFKLELSSWTDEFTVSLRSSTWEELESLREYSFSFLFFIFLFIPIQKKIKKSHLPGFHLGFLSRAPETLDNEKLDCIINH